MADGGGTRATVELLLHFHGFQNIDLRSRGLFCVEAVAFPLSSPGTPGVPFRTFCDPKARRSAARGVTVNAVDGDVNQRGVAGTSKGGKPSYTSSLLPIRFTNEQVQLNEGSLFRIHIDADWLETDVIVLEFRLMSRTLPDGETATEGSSTAALGPETLPETLKEVGRVTLHAKCASAKGGLHRYHPIIFPQPHLCLFDVTFHMALTGVNHPGGPAGLATAIAANAFPSEDCGASTGPAPRRGDSPGRQPPGGGRLRHHNRSMSSGRLPTTDNKAPTPPRPRFLTPGRTRKSAFVARGRSSSFGASASSSSGALGVRPHRIPLTAAALDAAGSALGLAAALGYASATLDADRGGPERAVYTAAELLYSRHALGLRWSKGTLAVAKAAAADMAAEVAAATDAAARTAATAKKKSRAKSKRKAGGGGAKERVEGAGVVDDDEKAVAANAESTGGVLVVVKNATQAQVATLAQVTTPAQVVTDADGVSATRVGEDHGPESAVGRPVVATSGEPDNTADGDTSFPATGKGGGEDGGSDNGHTKIWGINDGGAEEEAKNAVVASRRDEVCEADGADGADDRDDGRDTTNNNTGATPVVEAEIPGEVDGGTEERCREKLLSPPAYKEVVVQPHDIDAATEVPSDSTPKSDVDEEREEAPLTAEPTPVVPRSVMPPALPPPAAEVEAGTEEKPPEVKVIAVRQGRSRAREGVGSKGGTRKEKSAWMWGGASSGRPRMDTPKKPLPSDVRQLSRVIHSRLSEESTACSKLWNLFAKATFESGRRGLYGLREQWVRDTQRAWSGQCLENVSIDRDDLLRLNEAFLDPDGFLPLRARAGIRLKRHASPMRGGGGGSNKNARLSLGQKSTSPAEAPSRAEQQHGNTLPNGVALPKVLSISGAWSDARTSKPEPAATNGDDNDGDGDDDDHPPPLLDALVRKDQGQPAFAAGAPVFTPKAANAATTSTWGTVSPWASGSSAYRPEGWLSRLSSGGTSSSPTFSATAAAGGSDGVAGAEAAGGKGEGNEGAEAAALAASVALAPVASVNFSSSPKAGVVIHFPPPPQSLLPVFDRELHGFDASAPQDDRWGDLPFLVVDSWGGSAEEPSQEPAPCSPTLGANEYRLFKEIASNSNFLMSPTHKKTVLKLPKGIANGHGSSGGGDSGSAKTVNGGGYTALPGENNITARNNGSRISAAAAKAAAVAAAVAASAGNPPADPDASEAITPPPLLDTAPRSGSNVTHSIAAGAPCRPGVPPAASPSSSVREGKTPGSDENKCIWDQPASPWQKARGPKYYTARRPRTSRVPSLPPSGPGVGDGTGGGGGGGGGGGPDHQRRSSVGSGILLGGDAVVAREGGGYSSGGGGTGSGYSSSDDSAFLGGRGDRQRAAARRTSREARRTRRADIQRRMWGKRPEWTTALLAPTGNFVAAADGGGRSGSGGGGAAMPRAGGAGGGRAAEGRAKPLPTESGRNQLIVLVHGLGGRPADMALVRGYLQTLMPGAELMVATSLQDMRKDNLGVEAMGHRLAEEVHAHITRFCPYFTSPVIAVSTTAPTANAGSLPLSPVTPMRPTRGSNVQASPVAPRGVHASPGSAATARAVSDALAAGGGGGAGAGMKGMGTPGRTADMRGSAKGGKEGGAAESKGMLSFVCFSMGGLVARSALLEPAMVPYLTSLHCFVTLACPHLGQTSTPLSFFKTGAWAVRKLTGLRVLHELDLDDAEDPRETTLYRLSFSPGLERFRTIVFAANPRDGFVPLHSASVRSPPEVDANASAAVTASAEMAEMLMSKFNERKNRVVRMTLDAPRSRQAQGALDSVIGRAGHMCFIESAQVAWLISLALLPFMEEGR